MYDERKVVLTPDCVMAVGKVVETKDVAMVLGIPDLKFRKLLSGAIAEHIIYDGHMTRFKLPDNSTYSVEFLKKAQAIITEIKYGDQAELWQSWSEGKRRYIKDHPIMIRYDDLGIIIAPIIDRGE